MSAWRRLEIDALIDRQRGAQVVRHGLEQAGSDAGRWRPQVGGLARLLLETLALGDDGDLRGERVQHALVLARQRAAVEHERDAIPEVPAHVGVLGSPPAARHRS